MVTIVDDQNLGYALGATDYLTKPVDRERLAAPRPQVPATGSPRAGAHRGGRRRSPARVLRTALERDGWAVDEAENGRVGLDAVARRRPALILLDLMMPEMDGFAFVAELSDHGGRAAPSRSSCVTAKDLTPEERQRLNGSVEVILQKGAANLDALLAEIRTLVSTAADTHPETPSPRAV